MFDLNRIYKNRGAISIFLVIVLVPMIVLSSIFVDMSRITLAKSVASSSGTLTLNTALTNYDAVLKDMYGLFATSQNTDELFENLETYYLSCIEAAGVAETDAENYVGQIMDYLKSEAGNDDLLNMDLTSFEVTKPTGGDLANPAILKSQIVEFMKYRAPINLGMGIIDALSSIKNIKKQSKLVDDKNKFYDTQTDMMGKLESAWRNIENYQYLDAGKFYAEDTWTFPDGDYLATSFTNLKECVSNLELATAYIVNYLYYADSYYQSISGSGVHGTTVSDSDEYTEVWTTSDGREYKIYTVPEEKDGSVSSVIENLEVVHLLQLTLKKENEQYNTLAQGNANLSTTEKIRIVSVGSKAIESGYGKNVEDFMVALVALQNSLNECDAEELAKYTVYVNENTITAVTADTTNPSGEKRGPLKTYVQTQITSHLTETDGSIINVYNNLLTRVQNYYTNTKDIVNAARSYVNVAFADATSRARILDAFLASKITYLENAIRILGEVKSDLTNENSSYRQALKAWEDSAGQLKGESIGDSDLSEIAKLKEVLTEDKITKLSTRLTSAKSSLTTLKQDLANFKIFGTSWKDFTHENSTYITLVKKVPEDVKTKIADTTTPNKLVSDPIRLSTVSGQYDTAYEGAVNLIKGNIEQTTLKTEWTAAEDASSPNLQKAQDALYTWMYSNFFDENKMKSRTAGREPGGSQPAVSTEGGEISANEDSAKNPESQKTMEAEAKKNNESSVKTSTMPDRELTTANLKNLPSGEWKNTVLQILEENDGPSDDSEALLSKATESLSMFDKLIELVGSMATTLRDDMYIVNYIMNMFSYSTFESEITVKNGNDIGVFESWYVEKADGTYDLRSDFGTVFKNSDQMLKDARTLTKVSINPTANYLYGQEVEYILYGQGGIAKAYGTIYLLRFVLNTVYAFTDAEIGSITTSAATALFGVPPLTPLIPIAKIAMTIGFALAESAYDLYQLKCGESIPLIKNSKTWVMKPSSAAKAVVGEVLEEVTDKVIDEGAKLLNDVLTMTDEQLTNAINEATAQGKDYLAGIADEALRSTMDGLEDYANQVIQELVNICNSINAEVMSAVEFSDDVSYVKGKTPEKITAAIEQLDAWLAQQGSSTDDLVYLVKKTAVDYLKENGGQKIGEVLDAIENVSGETSKEKVATLLHEKLDAIRATVSEKVESLADTAGNKLNEMKNEMLTDLRKAANDGVESLRTALKDKISSTFGTSTGGQTGANSVVSTLLYWHYSDYLQLLLLVGTVVCPESILLRTADLIELNMRQINQVAEYIYTDRNFGDGFFMGLLSKIFKKKEVNPELFKLNKAYTYINIKATISVKPMLLTLPLMTDTVESELTGTSWYQIAYEGTMGY